VVVHPALVRIGYTLVELIVALLVFAVGGLALASTSAILGRALNTDAVRERAARIAATQIERLAAGCGGAPNGQQNIPQIHSEWTVLQPGPGSVEINESVSYQSSHGMRTDSYRAVVGCP
jgi:prepilin-type N-terminal cleavage/methylation domain-containing protein